MPQTLDGLDYLHQNGVIHRDIKAANLMVDKAGKVVIGDFGLAKELFSGGEEHSTVGTPHWRAFRRVSHPQALPSTDVSLHTQSRPRRSSRAAGTRPRTSGRWAAPSSSC